MFSKEPNNQISSLYDYSNQFCSLKISDNHISSLYDLNDQFCSLKNSNNQICFLYDLNNHFFPWRTQMIKFALFRKRRTINLVLYMTQMVDNVLFRAQIISFVLYMYIVQDSEINVSFKAAHVFTSFFKGHKWSILFYIGLYRNIQFRFLYDSND